MLNLIFCYNIYNPFYPAILCKFVQIFSPLISNRAISGVYHLSFIQSIYQNPFSHCLYKNKLEYFFSIVFLILQILLATSFT